jgi:hypothetical protein
MEALQDGRARITIVATAMGVNDKVEDSILKG